MRLFTIAQQGNPADVLQPPLISAFERERNNMTSSDFTVFYAWQSDSPQRDNRNFIESAIKLSLKNLHKSGVVESPPRLDKDTKDVPGIPDIANTIFEKIRTSDCFVCDVSLVGKTTKSDEEELLPNPNVMIELGYALSELGWERIILVMNTVTGSTDNLPFDLRNRRWPITYELSPDSDESIRPEEKTELAKQIQAAIEPISKLPSRQKRGTTEQRVDVLEEMVGKLSGTLAQYSTIANLVAGLQQVGGSGSKSSYDPKSKCFDLRSSLISRVTAGDFEGVVVRQGILVLVIFPSSVPFPLPLFESNNEDMLRLELRPLYAVGWDYRRYGERLVTFSKWQNEIDAVTEITTDGNLFAAGHEVISVPNEFLDRQAPEDLLHIPSVSFEKNIIESVSHYLKAFKALGTKGPWYLGIGITNMKRSVLEVGIRYAFGGRVFEGHDIMPPIIEVGVDEDVGVPQRVARIMRPAFDYVWREHNYPQSLNYGDTGDWIGQ